VGTMKILIAVLVVLFILGTAIIIIPILFPSFFFKTVESFLDWKGGIPDDREDT
jgi:hypothetical protein